MLLRDLYKLHGQLIDQRLMLPEGFRRSRVHLVVDLDQSGEVRSAPPPTDETNRALDRVVPDFPRTAQVAASLVTDKLGYVIGLATPDKQTRGKAQHAAYQDCLRACAAGASPDLAQRINAVQVATADPARFARELRDDHGVPLELRGVFEPADDLSADELKAITEQSQWLVDFAVEGTRFFPSVLHDNPGDPECVAWWSARVADQSTSDRTGYCQVTESTGPLARLLPGIGELPGNAPRLISCNFEAASRYGAGQSDGAAISAAAAGRASQALKWLAGEGRDRHRWNLDELVLVWWCPDDLGWDPLEPLREPDPAAVGRVMSSPLWSGRPTVTELSEFHMAALTVNTARVVVRADHSTTLSRLQDRLRAWFGGLQPIQDKVPGAWLGIPTLAADACPPGKNRAGQRSRVATDLLRHALLGEQLPRSLRDQLVRRCGVGTVDRQGHRQHVTAARAALLHAIALSWKENPMPGSQAEICGRLLAVLEHTQQRALGMDLNRGVQASYGAAAATPQLVFPRLLLRRNAHAQRLRRDKPATWRYLDRQLEAVMADLANAGGFPSQLAPAGQAEFALGYWHTRHDLNTRSSRPNGSDDATEDIGLEPSDPDDTETTDE